VGAVWQVEQEVSKLEDNKQDFLKAFSSNQLMQLLSSSLAAFHIPSRLQYNMVLLAP
jgi:hypothetical protein